MGEVDAADHRGLLTTVKVPLEEGLLQPEGTSGGLDLKRHVYDEIGPMNTDELGVATALTKSSAVKAWFRNPEVTGVHLVGAWGRFFPDFVVWMKDGRVLVVEFKGRQLTGSDDTDRKEDLGLLWARLAGRKAAFYLVTASPDAKRPAQISALDLKKNVLGVAR